MQRCVLLATSVNVACARLFHRCDVRRIANVFVLVKNFTLIRLALTLWLVNVFVKTSIHVTPKCVASRSVLVISQPIVYSTERVVLESRTQRIVLPVTLPDAVCVQATRRFVALAMQHARVAANKTLVCSSTPLSVHQRRHHHRHRRRRPHHQCVIRRYRHVRCNSTIIPTKPLSTTVVTLDNVVMGNVILKVNQRIRLAPATDFVQRMERIFYYVFVIRVTVTL